MVAAVNPAEESAPVRDENGAERERQRIAGRAGIVALGTLVSRVLGLGRDMVLAAFFSRAATDAWMIAFQIPNMLRQLLAEGAVQTSVLPMLAQVKKERGAEGARLYFARLRGLWLVALAAVTALGVLFAPALVELFAAGFRARPGQYELTVLLTRWAFSYIVFMGSAALGLAALNLEGRFVVTSFAPALLNVAFIAFAFGVPSWLGARGEPPILAMALGALVGGALQVLAQWPSLRRIGYFSRPRLDLGDADVRETLRRLTPGLLGVGVYYVDVIIGRRLLSELGEGAVTYFGYALRLCDFSQGIFVMALSSATLPALSALAAQKDHVELGRTFAFSMRHALFIGIVSTAALLALSGPLVEVLLERGAFDRVATQETSRALVAQGASVFLVAGVRQLVLVYFALGRTRIPVAIAMVDLVVFWLASVALRGPLGHVGVSWGVTAARVVQFSLLFVGLRRLLPSTHGKEIALSGFKVAVASIVAALLAWLVSTGSALKLMPSPLRGLTALGLGGLVFLGVLWPLARALGSAELETIAAPLRRRLGWISKAPPRR